LPTAAVDEKAPAKSAEGNGCWQRIFRTINKKRTLKMNQSPACSWQGGISLDTEKNTNT